MKNMKEEEQDFANSAWNCWKVLSKGKQILAVLSKHQNVYQNTMQDLNFWGLVFSYKGGIF